MAPEHAFASERHVFNFTDAAHLSKPPPAAYCYYGATGRMLQIGRTSEIVKTRQEIATKFAKKKTNTASNFTV